MAEDKAKPSPQIAGKFEVVLVEPGPIYFRGNTYDLRTIDLETATKLSAEKGFPYLKAIVPGAKTPATS